MNKMSVFMMILSTLLGASFASAGVDPQDNPNFPFQPNAIQFRLNQGFFTAGAELLQDILKSSGMVDKNNSISIYDKDSKQTNFLKYNTLKTSIKLDPDTITGNIAISIAKSRFYINQYNLNCHISLTGDLSFAVVMQLTSQGTVAVSVPKERFNNSKLAIDVSECSFLAQGLIADAVPVSIQAAVQEAVKSLANDEQLKFVASANVDESLKKANVFINVPTRTTMDPIRAISQFALEFGILGYLSNNQGGAERISIDNPRKAYLNQMGMQWSLDAGVLAETKNIYNPNFQTRPSNTKTPLPEWGLVPYKKMGAPIDFDAGLMIRTGFLKSLFDTLYQAGFFNLQMQDSLLDKTSISIDPTGWSERMHVTTPDGQLLTKANYADSRLELRFAAPPSLNVRNEKEFQLAIPDFYLSFYAKAKGSDKEFEVVRFRAKFNLVTQIGMDGNARLAFKFNDQPISDFKIISRSGIAASIPDTALRDELNTAVVGILNQSAMDIPFIKGKRIEVKSLGIDAQPGSDQALAMYLKIK